MAQEQPRTVRAAQAVVNAMDRVIGVFMGTLEAMHSQGEKKEPVVPLAGFKRATAIGAKGAKWSLIALFILAALAMGAALLVVPRLKTVPPAAAPVVAPAAAQRPALRAAIERNCRAGRYRALPEIEKAECADRPLPVPAQHQGDAK